MQAAISDYVQWMRHQNFAESTDRARERVLNYLLDSLASRDVYHPYQVTHSVVEQYQAHLQRSRKHNGDHLGRSCQRDRLVAVRCLFRWLHEHNRLRHNPAARIVLPQAVLSISEVEAVLAQLDVTTPDGPRDRALMELFYSTGIRRAEAGGLDMADIDRERRLVRIRQGKGRKDRVVPIGRRAMAWLDRYVRDARPAFRGGAETSALFLRSAGRSLPLQRMTQLVHAYIRQADLPRTRRGSCHALRHTAATLMFDQGADVRYIQAMLGHAKLSTTRIYTHVSIRQLQKVHGRTHPAERDGHEDEVPTSHEQDYMI